MLKITIWQNHLAESFRKCQLLPAKTRRKKRILSAVIFWNMFSANPANAEQGSGDIFSLNPHICCYALSLFIVYLSRFRGFTTHYSLAQTLSSSILHRKTRDYFWSIKIILFKIALHGCIYQLPSQSRWFVPVAIGLLILVIVLWVIRTYFYTAQSFEVHRNIRMHAEFFFICNVFLIDILKK